MKVALACNYPADYGGNFISSLKSIEEAAKRNGVPLEIVYIFAQGRENDGLEWLEELQRNHKVYFIPKNSTFAIANALYRLCRKEKFDILHAHFFPFQKLAMAGALTRTKIIAHFHNTFLGPTSMAKKLLLKALLPTSFAIDRCMGCSEAVKDSLVAHKWPADRCTFVTNRIDFSRLDASKDDNTFDPAKNNLLILGTAFERKGCDLALQAIAPIAAEHNIMLHIISHNFEKLENDIRRTMGDIPRWVSFARPTEYIGDYYRNARILLSPSREEGFCTAVLEAAYCNCAVIKSDIPQMVHGLKNEDFIRVPLTADALRNKIVEILSMDSSDFKTMTDAFRKEAIEKYDMPIWGEEVLQHYQELLK